MAALTAHCTAHKSASSSGTIQPALERTVMSAPLGLARGGASLISQGRELPALHRALRQWSSSTSVRALAGPLSQSPAPGVPAPQEPSSAQSAGAFAGTPLAAGPLTGNTTMQSAAQEAQAAFSGPPKLVIFGGRGFVGTAVCKEALKTGLHVVVLSRSGTPPPVREPWMQDVEYLRGDALEPRTYQDQLPGAVGAISCIGGFGNNEQMRRINGTANVTAINTAKSAGVPRFVFVSAHIPSVPGLETLAAGYVQGKRAAEQALFEAYPDTGVVLRPWVIHGTRVVSAHMSLPLSAVFGPAAYAVKRIPNAKSLAALPLIGSVFIPPVSVEAVARAAVAAATDDSVAGGVIDNWRLTSEFES